jgi:subtilisin family serine protease
MQMTSATERIIDSLRNLKCIEYAQPDVLVYADFIPDDPVFNEQWALHNTGQSGGTPGADINAPEAWNITTGDTNIVVGVIDTGIDYLHPDLAQNIWTNWDEIPGNGIDDDNNGYIDDVHGWDFFNNDNDPMDDYHSHGTHVAGIIGAVGNNIAGVAGVAWKVRLMPLKFIGSAGWGILSAELSAIEYAIDNNAKITNNSYRQNYYQQAERDAIYSADTAGMLFIAAAGNDAINADIIPQYPASYDLENIISVAAADRYGELASFSNWGMNNVDLVAPGKDIISTAIGSNYFNMSGTSMASPFVSGIAALIW